jgi:hypothetical protein
MKIHRLAPDPQGSLAVLPPDHEARLVNAREDENALGDCEQLLGTFDLLGKALEGDVHAHVDLPGRCGVGAPRQEDPEQKHQENGE